jgi:hypothetical protein
MDENSKFTWLRSHRNRRIIMILEHLGLLLSMFFGPELHMFQPEGNDGSYLAIATRFAFAAAPSMILAWRERDT